MKTIRDVANELNRCAKGQCGSCEFLIYRAKDTCKKKLISDMGNECRMIAERSDKE